MKTRKKLIVKNKNIKKRYVGDRLVYRKEEFLKLTLNNVKLRRATESRIIFKVESEFRTIGIEKIQLNNSEPQDLKESLLFFRTVEGKPLLVLYIDREELDNFFIQQGVEEEFKTFDITFYYKKED